jgi:hypothetical protein
MTRRFSFLVGGLALAWSTLSGPAALAGSDSRWFHVKVDETGPDGDRVRINLPIHVVEAALPLIQSEGMTGGRIRINGRDLRDADLRALLEATRHAEDGEYVKVDGRDERVLVTKKDGELLLEASERGEDAETVTIRLPMDVLDALLSGPRQTLNLEAAVRVLKDKGDGEFITVRDHDSTVRIWIDDRNAID